MEQVRLCKLCQPACYAKELWRDAMKRRATVARLAVKHFSHLWLLSLHSANSDRSSFKREARNDEPDMFIQQQDGLAVLVLLLHLARF